MNAAQTELFHSAVLQVLDANGSRFGLGAQAVALLVNQYGFSPKPDETERALEYLADQENGFARPVDKQQMNPANRTWKITAKGINYLRERGL